MRQPEAVVIAGWYGAGKSSVAAEMAGVLEKDGLPYAAIDLDWLAWADAGGEDDGDRLFHRNLAAVLANDLDAGVRYVVLAGFVRDAHDLERLRETVRIPLRCVRLDVPLPEIERRLAADITSGRQDDLREARRQAETSAGVGIEDLTLTNDRPLPEVALEVLGWLGWI